MWHTLLCQGQPIVFNHCVALHCSSVKCSSPVGHSKFVPSRDSVGIPVSRRSHVSLIPRSDPTARNVHVTRGPGDSITLLHPRYVQGYLRLHLLDLDPPSPQPPPTACPSDLFSAHFSPVVSTLPVPSTNLKTWLV